MEERAKRVLLCVARRRIGMACRAWTWLGFGDDSALAEQIAAGGGVLDALAAETECMWARNALMRAALVQTVPPAEAPLLRIREVERRYRLAWNMEEAQRRFLERPRPPHAPPLGESERLRARYMFHYASRERVDLAKARKRKHIDGETVRNSFVAFLDAAETLRFFREWDAAEIAAPTQEKSMVFECGSYAEDVPRKWVIDIDADLAKLTEAQQREWGGSPDAVVAFALEISRELCRAGYLRRPCHLAITSRHVPAKKLSWHVTLCALAPFPRWREAMTRVGRALKHPMLAFVDERVLRNSKSQYMQILGSTKVAMGRPGNGICFEPVGLFDGGDGGRLPLPPRCLFFAASSIMLHDPWSVPFRPAASSPHQEEDNSAPKKRGKRAAPTDDKEVQKKTKADHSRTMPQPWMHAFVEARDGTTRFATPPCVQAEARCDVARRIGVAFHACASSPSMCPHIFAAEGRVYQHGTNRNAIVVCTERRLFMRCFSDKCKKKAIPPRRHAGGGAWVEIFEEDLVSDAVARACTLRQTVDSGALLLHHPTDRRDEMIPRRRKAVDDLIAQRLGGATPGK